MAKKFKFTETSELFREIVKIDPIDLWIVGKKSTRRQGLQNRTSTLWNTIECCRGFEDMKDEINSSLKVQMKWFFLLPNLKEQQKSGRSPFTVS